MDTTLFSPSLKNEQISAEQELSLIFQAQERFKLLTTNRDLALAEKKIIRQGERALERLLASQIKYIELRIQRLFAKMPRLSREDLIQSAQEGVIEAIRNFDRSKGVRLITWAWHQVSIKFKSLITGEIKQSNAEQNAKRESPVSLDQPQVDVVQLDDAQKVISRFKPLVQSIIALRSEGYEFPAIAKRLGKTADACRMSYNRAIQRIRQQLLPIETTPQPAAPAQWMSKLRLRWGKNVRFGKRTRHNAPRVSRPIMSKRFDKALLAVFGLATASILGFAAVSVGRVPQCQTQTYNIGLPIFTVLLLGIPFITGYALRGLLSKGVNPSAKRLRPFSSR
jgi:RNA polymerase sigma factor (sigma-70 family)